jgi:hypothetical protein
MPVAKKYVNICAIYIVKFIVIPQNMLNTCKLKIKSYCR